MNREFMVGWIGVFDELEDATRSYHDVLLIYQLRQANPNRITTIEECD